MNHVHVGGGDARLGIGPRPGFDRRGGREIGRRRDHAVVRGLGRAQHVDGMQAQIAGAVAARHHQGGGAVGHQAAVAHAQGRRQHASRQALLDAQGFADKRLGVELRPLACRHRHLGELRARGTKFVHMARGCQRVGRSRHQGLVRRLEGRRQQRAHQLATGGALVAAVGDQGHVALAGGQRQRGPQHVGLKSRAAHAVVVGQARVYAQVFGQAKTGEKVGRQADEQAVDVGRLQAGAGQGRHAGAHGQFHGRLARRLADAVGGGGHDGGGGAREGVTHGRPRGDETAAPVRRRSGPRGPARAGQWRPDRAAGLRPAP